MIYLYSGTPGSGKSLHAARVILGQLNIGHPVVCNFDINRSMIKRNKENFHFVPNEVLKPELLRDIADEYFSTHKFGEGKIMLIIDEAQLIFNSREWGAKDRSAWTSFFSCHRHEGYDVILIAQFDRMLDRQIRGVLEYELVHRKVSNLGIKGKLLSLIFGGKLFVCVKMWYPLRNEKIGHEFFTYVPKYAKLYDSYQRFGQQKKIEQKEAVAAIESPEGDQCCATA